MYMCIVQLLIPWMYCKGTCIKFNYALLMLPFTKSVFNYVWVLAPSLTCFEYH